MTLDGDYRGTLDRIEEGIGVVLVEDDGTVIDEVHVRARELPEGVAPGAVLALTFDGGTLCGIAPRPAETERRRRALQDRFDRLSERPPGRDEER